jgi:hypothetical protein
MFLKLDHVVPFVRSFDEYQKMFDLTEYQRVGYKLQRGGNMMLEMVLGIRTGC